MLAERGEFMERDIKISGICVMVGNDEAVKSAVIRRIQNKNMTMPYSERVWIIENPENNLHPEMQTSYAETYAKMAEEHGKMLVTTNSFHFLEAFIFFMQQNEVYDTARFYTVQNGKVLYSSNPQDAYRSLSQPAFDLADMKLESEMERG